MQGMSRPFVVGFSVALVLAVSACGETSFENLADVGECDPAGATFNLDIDNPYHPLPVGHQIVLEGTEGGRPVLVRITVLDETETVAGVETRVVEEYEEEGGRLVEISRNFFAQNQNGTVCYFGEEVDDYDANGNVVGHAGGWRADGETNRPGIIMPGSLAVGDAFQTEVAPGIAEDQAKVLAIGETTTVPGGTFDDTVTLREINPLEGGGGDTKVFAKGIGIVVDGPARMTSHTAADG